MPLSQTRAQELSRMCRVFRYEVLEAIYGAQSGHPGGSLSVCEILTLLYQEVMNIDSANPADPDRDRLVLCKGHAAPMLYRNLIEKGFLPKDSMSTLRALDSQLQGHPSNHTPGVEMPSGPLGIGLSSAQGMAIGLKLNASPARVFAILGDGELDEGCVWETVTSAVKFKLDNLLAIVDHNKVQLDGTTDEVMPLLDLTAKFAAFGWNVLRCDGHDIEALYECIAKAAEFKGAPTVIIADTIKGKGISFMEGKAAWHGKAISDADFENIGKELGGAINA
jgi:transketolase